MDSEKKKLAGVRLLALADGGQPLPLVERVEQGGGACRVLSAPGYEQNPDKNAARLAIREFGNRLLTGEVDVVIFRSLSGARWIVNGVCQSIDQQRFLGTLTDITTVASPAALAPWQIQPTIGLNPNAPWQDIISRLDARAPLSNLSVAIEDSAHCHGLIAAIEARGGRTSRIPVFDLLPGQSDGIDWAEPVSQILAGEWQAVYLASEQAAARLLRNAGQQTEELLRALASLKLLVDESVALFLADQGLSPSVYTVVNPETGDGISAVLAEIKNGSVRFVDVGQPAMEEKAAWYDSPFMRACRGEPTDVTPIWMMRQAGRYMAEYRAVREKVPFLELCGRPQLCSEVMCTAVERLGVDAAIIFSDLLPILVPMGCDLEFVKGDGPVIHNPVREPGDIDRILPLTHLDDLQFVMETVRQTRADLPADMPLIGFAGAPFTLASYMIEGGSSRNYVHTKRLMYSDPGAWNELMSRLASSISIYLRGQVQSGAQCLQLFDSWAGCLSFDDYERFVLPHVQQIIRSIPRDVPVINFATGNPALLPHLARTSARVIGVDWRIRLDTAWSTVGHRRSVQGNLDPTILLSNPTAIREAARQVLAQAASRPGHIFNLGHGILPMTPVEHAIALVEIVHELSSR